MSPTPVTITLHELVLKDRPPKVPDKLPRQSAYGGVEFTTYTVTAVLNGWKISSDDSDIHLVIENPPTRETMIVEFPNPACLPATTSRGNRREITAARLAITKDCSLSRLSTKFRDLQGEATITGVGFFDKKHRQTGVANNGIELHPVLGFTSTNCRPRPPGG